MATENISGIFSASLKKVAHWFLYIFIAADAQLPAAIMQKRKRQIEWLRKLDKWNTYYNFNQLVQIVSEGIQERYKQTPVEVLQLMYNTVTSPAVGTAENLVSAVGVENLKKLAVDANGQKTNIWSDIASVIEWLVQLVQSLGITSKRETWTSSTPDYNDWNGEYKSNAGITGALPYVVGGVIIYYLFTKTKK